MWKISYPFKQTLSESRMLKLGRESFEKGEICQDPKTADEAVKLLVEGGVIVLAEPEKPIDVDFDLMTIPDFLLSKKKD